MSTFATLDFSETTEYCPDIVAISNRLPSTDALEVIR